jgi:broad specificity phosphatase PhoE
MKTKTIYFLRHGEVYNPAGVMYYRLPAFFLSDHGQEEVLQAARFMEDVPLDRIYHSPMERAWQTALILNGDRGDPFECEVLLNEFDKEETLEELMQRVTALWTQLCESADTTIMCVSHRETIRALLLHLAGEEVVAVIDDLDHTPLPTAGIYRVTTTVPVQIDSVFTPEAVSAAVD